MATEPAQKRHPQPTFDEEAPIASLFARLGAEPGRGMLATRRSILPRAHNRTDRLNLVTDQFSSHPSTANLAKQSAFLLMPTTGYLTILEEADSEVTQAVQSRSGAWIDKNDNLRFDPDAGEVKRDRPLVVAARRGTTGPNRPWRAIVAADATMFADFALGNRTNQQFAYDSINWLIGTEAMTGTVQREKDVRIRHTKEGQTVWFYGTVLGVPLLLFAAGALVVWRRKGGRT